MNQVQEACDHFEECSGDHERAIGYGLHCVNCGRRPTAHKEEAMTPRRSLQINPAPLRIVPAAVRDTRPVSRRCEARTKTSGHRCMRDGVDLFYGRWLCKQHGAKELRGASEIASSPPAPMASRPGKG